MQIAQSALTPLRRHLVDRYPAEGCGFLLGKRQPDGDVMVSHQLSVHNHRVADGAGRDRYFISPDDVRSAERDAGASGLQIVGVYHSHPNVSARPSSYDREHAWPWYRYLIVSVVGGAVRDQRVWELADDRSRFVEHPLRIEDS